MKELRNSWRAVYIERCTYGSEGDSQKPGIVIYQGVGCLPYKTTTATTLSVGLQKRGAAVALLDFDGQGHSSYAMGVKNVNTLEVTINTIICQIIREEVLPSPDEYIIKTASGVALIPSNSQLYSLERNLCGVDFRERILSQFVDTIRDQYDHIIIDCMPQIGTPLINVMMCADSIIIPSQAELSSAQGLTELLKHYRIIQKNSNHHLCIEGILITMDSAGTNLSKEIKALLDIGFSGSIPIFETHIPRSIKVAEAFANQKTICEYLPRNPAAIAYERFVGEFLAKERKAVGMVG